MSEGIPYVCFCNIIKTTNYGCGDQSLLGVTGHTEGRWDVAMKGHPEGPCVGTVQYRDCGGHTKLTCHKMTACK